MSVTDKVSTVETLSNAAQHTTAGEIAVEKACNRKNDLMAIAYTARRLFENFKKFSKITEFEFQNSGTPFFASVSPVYCKKF